MGLVDFAKVLASQTITRPADTTAYASGDLVADSTSAGSVTPFAFGASYKTSVSYAIRIDRVRLVKSTTSTTNASFRVHLYSASPVPVNGDNAAFSTPSANYIGAFDVTVDRAFSDGAGGAGVPVVGASALAHLGSNELIYGLIEARAAYTPGNAETFTLYLETYRFA